MQPSTIVALDELTAIEWFAHVGEKVPHERIVVLSSWKAAVAHCSSDEWEQMRLDSVNRTRATIHRASETRFHEWKQVMDEVKRATVPLVERKVAAVRQANRLPLEFENCVQWDILHYCMEHEYCDILPPGTYRGLAYWYLKGRFPCGWDGQPPDGRMIVY